MSIVVKRTKCINPWTWCAGTCRCDRTHAYTPRRLNNNGSHQFCNAWGASITFSTRISHCYNKKRQYSNFKRTIFHLLCESFRTIPTGSFIFSSCYYLLLILFLKVYFKIQCNLMSPDSVNPATLTTFFGKGDQVRFIWINYPIKSHTGCKENDHVVVWNFLEKLAKPLFRRHYSCGNVEKRLQITR